MALSPESCAANLWTLLQSVAALNPDGSPKDKGTPRQGNYASGFGQHYNDYAKQGEVLGATNEGGDISGVVNLLENCRVNESAVDVSTFAIELANFWSTVAVIPGDAAHGGSAVSGVVNNALAHIGDFEAAIMASITTEEKKPYYLHFIKNIEDIAVKKIIWTVTEVFPTGPSSFEESIS